MTVKQLFDPGTMALSRPDGEGLSVGSAPYSLDKDSETGYLRLIGNQDKIGLVVNHLEKKSSL